MMLSGRSRGQVREAHREGRLEGTLAG